MSEQQTLELEELAKELRFELDAALRVIRRISESKKMSAGYLRRIADEFLESMSAT